MARQNTQPVAFGKTRRYDQAVTMSSGDAGVVLPVTYIPLLRGDSASGTLGIDIDLAEMPKPLVNAVQANVQLWFVPKPAFPQFAGYDEFMHSYQGLPIKSLGQADRNPPPFFNTVSASSRDKYRNSTFLRTLGIHLPANPANTDLLDAFNLIYNFRLAAHSSKLERRKYAAEDIDEALDLPPAFWPSNRFSRVVPDYERALIVGSLDLDVVAGRLPVHNLYILPAGVSNIELVPLPDSPSEGPASRGGRLHFGADSNVVRRVYAEMAGESVITSLNDIDKARVRQAFAKLRSSYAGNDATGFDNDDVLVAELMQGLHVPEDQFKRPWLLANKRVTFGMVERYATDGASLDQSVSQGRASVLLDFAVPGQDVGGYIVCTLEVLPERIYERQEDIVTSILSPSEFPDALRDIQRTEPVDVVSNRRIDTATTEPNRAYGYEPMNDRWNREFTRLGGVFYQATPGAPWTENRSNIWSPEIVNPRFNETHFLAPKPFPHDVFSDTEAPAFEFVTRHDCTIVGLTQIGDVLVENNDDYEAVKEA